jgi:hypothetical protein
MKTTFITSVLFTLSVQVYVNAQSQFQSNNLIAHNSNYNSLLGYSNITNPNKNYETLNDSETQKKSKAEKINSDNSYNQNKLLINQLIESEKIAEETSKKLNDNRNYIKNLIKSVSNDNYAITLANNLNAEAEKYISRSIQLRKEAYMQPNNGSILGNIGNAEELEIVAIAKQLQVINVIERAKDLNSTKN